MKATKILCHITLVCSLLFSAPLFAESVLTLMSDSANSGIINTKILTDKGLDNTNIDATVVNGIAIFSGTVHSKEQVNRLIAIARSVSGVKGVNMSKLKIVKASSQ